MALLLGATLLAAVAPGRARAEGPRDVESRLLLVARDDVPLPQRLEAAAQLLGVPETLDPELTMRAGTALLSHAEEPASWLLLRALDAGWVQRELRQRARGVLVQLLDRCEPADAARRARLTALGLLLGHRPQDAGRALTAGWPARDFVAAVLRREVGEVRDAAGARVLEAGADAVREALDSTRAAALLLDEAVEDDPEASRRGLDGLVALGAKAGPLLLHEAETGAAAQPAGRMPRAVRAIVALGFVGGPGAGEVLARCLEAHDGWVRVAAANALGDLGEPAGAVPLAVHCATLGDLYRTQDQWDWPGVSDTNVSQADWGTVDYYVVDVACADALMRLGVQGAAGYLIQEKLDPSKASSRIRVFQDSVDALRRNLPRLGVDDPETGYNVDAGLPRRDAAFSRLAFAWHALRDEQGLVGRTLDETDAGFRKAARQLADLLCGTDVRRFMITKPAVAMLGRCMTPTLIETVHRATRGSGVAELAETLGMVRDPRAIPTLLGLLRDERDFVRSRSAEALASYVGGSTEVRDALVALLDDPKDAPRVSALKALVAARPSAEVLAAVNAHPPRRPSQDWTMAETALRLVQEGAQWWPPIQQGLESEQRYVREAWWRLLRSALDWPEHVHDAKVAPGTPQARRVTEAQVLERLAQRRAP